MTYELKEKQQQFTDFNTRSLQMQNNVLWVKIIISVSFRFSVASLWLVTVDDSCFAKSCVKKASVCFIWSTAVKIFLAKLELLNEGAY